jgi:hypothetical protein
MMSKISPTGLFINSPLFGRCRLVPHDVDDQPTGPAVGYVELEGSPGTYPLAMNLRGEWRDRRDKPFTAPVTRWFSVVRADGGSPFNPIVGGGE